MRPADKKYKDALPGDTINKIRNILNDMDILTVEDWSDSSVEDCYSLRVTIDGTNLGTNGKGTTRAYALASAYAELMERLQNQLVYSGKTDRELKEHGGFYAAPDEKYLSVGDIVENDEPWTDVFSSMTSYESPPENETSDDPLAFLHAKAKEWFPEMFGNETREDMIRKWAKTNFLRDDGKFVGIPFYSVREERLTHIPLQIMQAAYGSNGMVAGNTPEEALVQGISEIFERYVCTEQFIRRKIIPPDIPTQYLRKYPYVFKTIRDIENSGPYRIIMKDCSLGMGFPVAGSVFIDYEHQTHMVKFGAHPDFEIAMERTLTETFQGRGLKKSETFPEFYYDDEIPANPLNIRNIITTGDGLFPSGFFSGNPDYEFTPPKETARDNREMLREMIALLFARGHDVLVRDVSFLDFPAFHVIVPGFSETEDVGSLRVREMLQFGEVRETVRKMDESSPEAFEKIIPFIRYLRGTAKANSLPAVFGLPIGESFPKYDGSLAFLLVLACYKSGRLEHAGREISDLINEKKADSAYLRCMRDYMAAKKAGRNGGETETLLNTFYSRDVVAKVISQLENTDEIFAHFYHRPNCWDCMNCEGGHACFYPNIEKILRKLKDRYAGNLTDQLANKNFFRDIL